ncbi:MAG TPA: prolipoprotein diacylglyceryl transferase [Bacteroidia bacterium]
MINSLLYIVWNADPEMFTIPGINWPVRWYGLLFAVAFVGSQFVMNKIYKTELRSQKDLDILTLYIILGTVLGARLGHVLFYQPEMIFEDPLSIIKIWEGGLASHGGAIGIILAMWLYCRKTKENWRWIFDRLIIVVALSGMCIRTGNLMNSEIIGKPTDASYGVVFVNPLSERMKTEDIYKEVLDGNIKSISFSKTNKDTVFGNTPATELEVTVTTNQALSASYAGILAERIQDYHERALRRGENHIFINPVTLNANSSAQTLDTFRFKIYGIPRHAAQIYEAIYCLFLFLFFYYLWAKKRDKFPQLFIFGLFCVLLFTERFFDEMLKENQVEFEDTMKFNMGQILSIPFVIIGAGMMIWSKRKNIFHQLPDKRKE